MVTKKFEYRRPRYRADVPIVVHISPQYSTCGRCRDVSAEGLGIRLVEQLPTGRIVTVEFTLEGCPVRASARIEYRCDGNYYGLRFQFSSEQERCVVDRMIESIQKIKKIKKIK
jgi:hypothetical protein